MGRFFDGVFLGARGRCSLCHPGAFFLSSRGSTRDRGDPVNNKVARIRVRA